MNLPDFLNERQPGEIALTGHRIGLYTIVRDYTEGKSAEQLHEEYPTLPLDLIQKVIAFYLANKTEVDEYVAAYRAELERQEALYGQRDLRAKLRQRYAQVNPDKPLPGTRE
ncbi:MAG TPA: DUF433 domain-containing protein [Gemmataceae bacterium]|jgi:uncharacterized protein (DUF433 family)|nr:DUF433 domain-containing protein [Gemmataceae bacterium]